MSGARALVVVSRDPACEARAHELAASLGLPFPEGVVEGALLLEVTPERLQLRPSGAHGSGPVAIDLSEGTVGRRRREAGLYKTPLARALGVTRARAPFVLDATGGLGTDSGLLAWMGCRVHAVEKSPVLAALWRDALARLERESPEVAARVTFEEADAHDVLTRLQEEPAAERPEVVYLDPMFPARTKSALVKKEMQVLQALHGDPSDEDATTLLTLARQTATKRAVIKRPRGKPPLLPGVTHAHEGSTTRLDVYVAG